MFRRLLVLLFLLASCTASAQRILTTPDFSGFKSPVPGEVFSAYLRPLPDGGAIVFGYFEVWYEGIRFRNLLRLRPNGEPDIAWSAAVNAGQSVLNVVVTPVGLFFSEGYPRALPPRYISLATGKDINPARAALMGREYFDAITNYDPATGFVYINSINFDTSPGTNRLRRISVATGEVDPNWFLAGGGARVDVSGGVWSYSFGCDSYGRGDSCTWCRRNLSEPPGDVNFFLPPPVPAPLPKLCLGGSFYGATRAHTYVGSRRFDAAGTMDSVWGTEPPLLILVTEKYAYLPLGYPSQSSYDAGYPRTIVRAATSGAGGIDDWRFPLPKDYYFYGLRDQFANQLMAWPTPGDANNLGVLLFKVIYSTFPTNTLLSMTAAFAVKEDLVGMEDPSVIEYYVPALKHYFLTGRKNEQITLDALPASFTRTGMSFAAKSSRYRDIAEQPVCRLYAAPEKGGSNSHFYGIGDDCPTLNKLTGVKYEGFDFSVLTPAASGCPATAPNAVTRLLNNKAAANDGNHRYVVSAATNAKMLAQGWIDEGAVFCSSSVTDAVLN